MSEEPQKEFLLAALRAASLRAKMYEVEINSIGVALKGGLITGEDAISWMREIGAMHMLAMVAESAVGKIKEKSK
jgi:hypothetical protein